MEEFRKMRGRIKQNTAWIALLCMGLLLVALLSDESSDFAKLEKLISQWQIIVALSAFGTTLVFVFWPDLSYKIDNVFLRTRQQVDHMICKRLLDIAEQHADEKSLDATHLRNTLDSEQTHRRLMDLFYEYASNEDVVNPVLRSHAFDYWGDYLTYMQAFALITLSALAVVAVALFTGFGAVDGVVLALLLGLDLIVVSQAVRGKTRTK
ncbi:MAG: hypothetical protein ACLFWB_10795, partial [Armatimonadota bacterium]